MSFRESLVNVDDYGLSVGLKQRSGEWDLEAGMQPSKELDEEWKAKEDQEKSSWMDFGLGVLDSTRTMFQNLLRTSNNRKDVLENTEPMDEGTKSMDSETNSSMNNSGDSDDSSIESDVDENDSADIVRLNVDSKSIEPEADIRTNNTTDCETSVHDSSHIESDVDEYESAAIETYDVCSCNIDNIVGTFECLRTPKRRDAYPTIIIITKIGEGMYEARAVFYDGWRGKSRWRQSGQKCERNEEKQMDSLVLDYTDEDGINSFKYLFSAATGPVDSFICQRRYEVGPEDQEHYVRISSF